MQVTAGILPAYRAYTSRPAFKQNGDIPVRIEIDEECREKIDEEQAKLKKRQTDTKVRLRSIANGALSYINSIERVSKEDNPFANGHQMYRFLTEKKKYTRPEIESAGKVLELVGSNANFKVRQCLHCNSEVAKKADKVYLCGRFMGHTVAPILETWENARSLRSGRRREIKL